MISFIVPAYNEARYLPPTLRAIHTVADALSITYELIVADDASTDATPAIAAAQGATVVSVAHRQIAATRNAGAERATGEHLFFVDADTLVNDATMRAAMRVLQEGAVGGGAGVRFDGRLPLYARLLVPPSVWLFRVTGLAAGCFLFCTRAAFEAVGGFDERLYGSEEIAMSRALKRHGRFVILRESVISSGRRLRAHSGWEVARLLGALALGGSRSVRDRGALAIWYDQRRDDPDLPQARP